MPNKQHDKHPHHETHIEESIRLSDEAARQAALRDVTDKPANVAPPETMLPTRDSRCLQLRRHIPMCDCKDTSPIAN